MESNNGIKLNRRQRSWNKFRKYVFIAGAAAAAVIIAFAATRGRVGKTTNTDAKARGQIAEDKTTEEQTSPAQESALKLAGPLKAERFTSAESFKNSVFVGDTFVDGLDDYGLIDEYYLFQSKFFPSTNAVKYVSDVAGMKPDKVFVMLGTDDANMNENISTHDVVENVSRVAAELKKALPAAKIYMISETPVTKEYEELGGSFYKQKTLDEINKGVEAKCKEMGVTYINIADAFKTNGYLDPEYTTDGYHINQEYYPYVLNGIANLIK